MTIGEDPCELTAMALGKALAGREISARDALDAHLARIAAHDGQLSAFLTVDAEGAHRQAAACDAARGPIGPLHGIPVAVKDLTNTKGLRTTYGSSLFESHIPDHDELVVARLRQAGAVIIGKTNTPEFGVAPVAGAGRSPFPSPCDALSGIVDIEQSAPDCGDAIEAFRSLRAAHVADSYGALLKTRRAELTPTVVWNIEAGGRLTAQDYLSAERGRTAVYRSFCDLFARTDFLVAPAASVLPWENSAGEVMQIDGKNMETPIDYLAVTFIVSLVGFPVLTLPTPRRVDEKPFGFQIVAAPGRESELFALGRRIEKELGFSHRRPPL